MFIAYTDCSIKKNKAYLAFVIVFENNSVIRKRIVFDESDNNIAEALAIAELLSFLCYYNIRDGLLLFDSNGVKKQLRRKKRKLLKHTPKDTYYKSLKILNVRTQVIPRRLNLAHRVCYENKYFASHPISSINRNCYQNITNYPDLYLQPSVLEEYRQLYNKRYATFHEAQMKLNKQIWLADLVEELGDLKVYAIHDKRIRVFGETIIKINKVNYVDIGNHWRVIRRGKKLQKRLNENINY